MSQLDRATVDALLTTTRSVRRRLDRSRPVDLALVDECLEIALQAPNGSGREPWRFIVVSDPAVRARLGEVYARSSGEYLASLRAADPDLDETTPTMVSSRTLWDHLGEVPVHVVPCVQLEPWHLTSPQRAYVEPSVWGSIFPAVWSFQLAARSRGLGTCMVTSLLKYDADVREILGVPDDVAIAGLIVVAHVEGTFSPARRRPLDEVRRRDHLGHDGGTADADRELAATEHLSDGPPLGLTLDPHGAPDTEGVLAVDPAMADSSAESHLDLDRPTGGDWILCPCQSLRHSLRSYDAVPTRLHGVVPPVPVHVSRAIDPGNVYENGWTEP